MKQHDEILKDFQRHLDNVYKVMNETVELIKEIHIKKYNQDEFRQIVSEIHYEKVMNHYKEQLGDANDKP